LPFVISLIVHRTPFGLVRSYLHVDSDALRFQLRDTRGLPR
jgi:hypothetical protein